MLKAGANVTSSEVGSTEVWVRGRKEPGVRCAPSSLNGFTRTLDSSGVAVQFYSSAMYVVTRVLLLSP